MKRLASLAGRGNDYVVVTLTVLLVTFGLAMLASASSNLSQLATGDTLYYLKNQLLYGLSLGIVGFVATSHIHYKKYERLAVFGMIFGIALLALTFTPLAFQAKGAARWVQVWSITFQPSEPLKLFFIIYLAAWLSGSRMRERHGHKGFVAFLVILGVVLGLLIKQPATSTAMLFGLIALIMYFSSGARFVYLPVILGLLAGGFALAVSLSDYRMARIEAFLNPEQNIQTSGYQANQAKNAIGHGKVLGIGYGQSTTKINYLPEPMGDSIFAVVSEELGFVGATSLIGLLFALITHIFILALKTREQFGHLLLIGFGSLIGIQSFVNIAAISGLIPLTGMSLPFVSYGSSALAVFITMMGIVNNISKNSV